MSRCEYSGGSHVRYSAPARTRQYGPYLNKDSSYFSIMESTPDLLVFSRPKGWSPELEEKIKNRESAGK